MELRGIPVSPGIEIGKACLYKDYEHIFVRKVSVPESDIESEVANFRDAVARTTEELKKVYQKLAEELGEEQAGILKAQIVFMEDRFLIDKTVERVRKELICAPYIFSKTIDEAVNVLRNTDNNYLRSRAEDIRYVSRAILRNMLGEKARTLTGLKEKVVIVAHDLSPADTAMMDKSKIISFVADIGARTSHTAIMAKSLEIPAVVGLENVSEIVNDGDLLIVDGVSGVVIINPQPEIVKEYEKKKRFYAVAEKELLDLSGLAAQTVDGHAVKLTANIELPGEISSVLSHGGEGIGLYRTEYLYLNRKDLPGEDEQYENYADAVSRLAPDRVVIRTVDLGGDKFISHIEMSEEVNPFMGCRGIRFCLEQPEIFRTQMRAILRAGVKGKAGLCSRLFHAWKNFIWRKNILKKLKPNSGKSGRRTMTILSWGL